MLSKNSSVLYMRSPGGATTIYSTIQLASLCLLHFNKLVGDVVHSLLIIGS